MEIYFVPGQFDGVLGVCKISSTYEVRGMIQTLTSYDNSGTALNQVQLAYNGFGQLTQECQESQDHATTIHTGTPAVGYSYDT